MDKAIYKIRGNVFFKLGIYILVAVLAYGTLYTGGLVLQEATLECTVMMIRALRRMRGL